MLKQRLFTNEEIDLYLPQCQAFTENEFGAADAFTVDYLRLHRTKGVQFYQAYGDFTDLPPRVLGIASCMFISQAMFDDMLVGKRKETQLEPWTEADGAAIGWVSAVLSEVPGAMAKCLSAVMDQLSHFAYRDRLVRIGAICTGPQGYLMARSFGMERRDAAYANGWLFMDRPLRADDLDELGRDLQSVWTMTKARDAIRQGRQIWGPDWNNANFPRPDGKQQ